eukprot:6778409-Ditylum_brightwellii.AAC.2
MDGKTLNAKFVWERINNEVIHKADKGDDSENGDSKPRISLMDASESKEEVHRSDPTPNKAEQDQDKCDDKQQCIQHRKEHNESHSKFTSLCCSKLLS